MVPEDESVRDGVGCQYNYVVSAQKPTAVTHSVVGNFTSSTDVNLVLGYCYAAQPLICRQSATPSPLATTSIGT
jgi:hypothetical protein